jgi:hypothetical protein
MGFFSSIVEYCAGQICLISAEANVAVDEGAAAITGGSVVGVGDLIAIGEGVESKNLLQDTPVKIKVRRIRDPIGHLFIFKMANIRHFLY